MDGAERFCSQARHWLTQPMSSGAASTTNTDCRIWNAIPGASISSTNTSSPIRVMKL